MVAASEFKMVRYVEAMAIAHLNLSTINRQEAFVLIYLQSHDDPDKFILEAAKPEENEAQNLDFAIIKKDMLNDNEQSISLDCA